MNEAKSYTVQILDAEYSVSTDETSERIDQIAHLVDSLAKEIVAKFPHMEHKKVFALVALRLAGDLCTIKACRNQEHEYYTYLSEYLDELAHSL